MKNSVKRQTRKVGVAGGFINQLMGNNITLPEVGKGATKLSYSDRHAYEVIEVNEDQSECVIREMDCKFVGSAYGDERYEYASNEENSTERIVWNEKKQCWGVSTTSVQIIKTLQNKLIKEFGFGWFNHLPVDKDLLYNEEHEDNYYNTYKLIPGVTKEYTNFSKVSIIFGIMEQYRDPSF